MLGWFAVGRWGAVVGCIGALGCGGAGMGDGDSSGADATAGGTEPATGAGPGDEGPDADGTMGGTSSATDGDTGGDPDGSSDSTGGTGHGSAGREVTVLPSSVAVLEDDDMGALTVQCLVTEDGAPYVGAVEATVTVAPNDGVSENGGVYTFDEFAIVDVTCDVEVEGEMLSATRPVAVLNEAIDPVAAQLGEGLGHAADGIFAILAADGQDDALLVDAVDRLDASLAPLAADNYVELADVLRMVPGGYPEGAALDAMGITTNADDAALPDALDDLDTALAAMSATVAGFDPDNPTQADADALSDHRAAVEAAVGALVALEPTAHGLVGARTRVADLMRDRVAPATETVVGWVDARTRSEAVGVFATIGDDPHPQGFGLLSLTIGMFGDSYLQVKLINDWYGKYIAQLDESINNFILAGGIEYFLPLGDHPPTIDLLVASASVGFATPGYPSWIDGYNFSEEPEMNLILVFGDSWQGIVDSIFGACGVEDANTIPEKIVKVFECVDEIDAAVQSIFVTPISVGPGQYGSQQGIDMGPFPDVCSGGLPTATFLLPISYVNGRGESYFVNCI